MAGYSKRSLVEKLGIKEGQRVYIGNAPKGYSNVLGRLPKDAALVKSLDGPCGFIQFFTKERVAVQAEFPRLKAELAQDGILGYRGPREPRRSRPT